MQVILLKDVENLGSKLEVLNVKNGYARNYLFPFHFAIEATGTNLRRREELAKVQSKKEDALLSQIHHVIEKLKMSPITIKIKTSATGKIFGSLTSLQVARAIHEQKGFEIDRKKITLPAGIKELGVYNISIDFGNKQVATVDIDLVKEG
ncbi:MAG: 50S ribosomal protein L9 [Phycisphaerales bacterium]|nr:50S ribosomal protein L9 [Phycisphaerales bacterium]